MPLFQALLRDKRALMHIRSQAHTTFAFSALLAVAVVAGCVCGSHKALAGTVQNEAITIDSLEPVNLGGVEQWILMQGEDTTKPVLLVLHGGPGFAMLPLFHHFNRQLERHFLVVNWDQRGSGLSYSEDLSPDTMTLDQFVSDAHELTSYLRKRFGQDKIYLLGHSWGSMLGMMLIKRYPNDFRAYVGVGQAIDVIRNEQKMFDFALMMARQESNQTAIDELEAVGRPDDDGEYAAEQGPDVTMAWVEHFGGDLYGKTSSDEVSDFIAASDIYRDKQAHLENGRELSQLLFGDSAIKYMDLLRDVPEVNVPVYLFAGRHDYDTPSEQVARYFEQLSAPRKELIWFERSAHFPFYEEPALFTEKMRHVLEREH